MEQMKKHIMVTTTFSKSQDSPLSSCQENTKNNREKERLVSVLLSVGLHPTPYTPTIPSLMLEARWRSCSMCKADRDQG